MFGRWFKKDPMKEAGARLYDDVVEAARRPQLYGPAGAPDTVDGRFDMIVMHAVLVMRRLREGGQPGQAAAQALFDRMFDDMDAALREMGTGDLKVGKKIREMGEAFYGRAKAFDEALRSGDEETLAGVVARNLYPDAQEASAEAQKSDAAGRSFARYMLKSEEKLAEQEVEALMEGRVRPRFASVL